MVSVAHRRMPSDPKVWQRSQHKYLQTCSPGSRRDASFSLSHAHVQMARELGMNPKKLGKLDNHDQEPWKLPLREFIGKLYFKRFGKERPDAVRSIEEMAAAKKAKKQVQESRPRRRAPDD